MIRPCSFRPCSFTNGITTDVYAAFAVTIGA